MRKHVTALGAGLVSCLVALSACSTSGGGNEGAGVTDDTITLGLLTDLSGPFAAGSKVQVDTLRAYWDSVNDDGGICEREIELDVRDHGYDPQRGVSLYRSLQPEVVAFQQVLGTPVGAAVLPLAEKDNVYVGGLGWASSQLDFKVGQIPGGTYSVESANAVDYLVDKLGLTEGDTVGVAYFVGDYGSDSLAGAEFAAEQHGLDVVGQEVKPTEQDLSAQAVAFERAGVDAVIVATGPAQLASLAAVLESQGYDGPIVANTPTFNPSVLDTGASSALLKNLYVLTQSAPYAATIPGAEQAAKLYESHVEDAAPDWQVGLAYAQGELLAEALRGACDADELTQDGVVDAMHEIKDFDAQGLFPAPLDYTQVGQPATRTIFISHADSELPGGLKLVESYEGPSAEAYSYN